MKLTSAKRMKSSIPVFSLLLATVIALSSISIGFAIWRSQTTASGTVNANGTWDVEITDASMEVSDTGAAIQQDYSGYALKNVCNTNYYGQACIEASVPRANSGSTHKTGTQSTSSTYKVSSWLWLVDTTRFDTTILGQYNTEERRLAMIDGLADGSIIRLSDTNTAPDGTKVSPIKAWYYYKNTRDYFGDSAARETIISGIISQSNDLIRTLRPDTYQNYALICMVSDNTHAAQHLQFVIADMQSESGAAPAEVTWTDTSVAYNNVDFSMADAWVKYAVTVKNNSSVDASMADSTVALVGDESLFTLSSPDFSQQVLKPGESATITVVVQAKDESTTINGTANLDLKLIFSQPTAGQVPSASVEIG